MDECYLVLCTNVKTDDLRVFVAFRRSDAESIKSSFFRTVENMTDWSVNIVRSVEE